jgi:hypothetical protein
MSNNIFGAPLWTFAISRKRQYVVRLTEPVSRIDSPKILVLNRKLFDRSPITTLFHLSALRGSIFLVRAGVDCLGNQ